MILEEFNDAKIEIVDSRSNCMQLGYAAIVAARAAKQGQELMEVKKAAEDNIKRSRFLFIPDTLEYLRKGGRIGGAGALIGSLLKIIPILTVEDGKTTVLTKVRTKPKAVMTMVEKMLQEVSELGVGEVMVHHINCYDEAKALAGVIMDKLNIKVGICDIGPVIGLHVGPGAIGIVYYTNKNMRS
jgi:DegV family protein with EDD domain